MVILNELIKEFAMKSRDLDTEVEGFVVEAQRSMNTKHVF